jgi:predicted nucleic acid-binding protein
MRYVLDSNVALKWVLNEPESPKAVGVRDGFAKGLHELLSPDVFPVEVAHALAKAERRGTIPRGDGYRLLNDIFNHMPALHPYLPLLPGAFSIASAARIGVYDCLYVALAEREGCALLTADDRLVRSLPGRPIMLLSSLP